MFSNVKYVRAGHRWDSPIMYVIVRNRTEHGSWKVEVFPADINGCPISDAIIWDIFPTWYEAWKYSIKKHREYTKYVNEGL